MTNKPPSTVQTNGKQGQLQGCLKFTFTNAYLAGEKGRVDLFKETGSFHTNSPRARGAGSVLGQGGGNRTKGASRAAEAHRHNIAKQAFCHVLLFFFVVVNISTIKASKIWCTLDPRIKNLSF